MRHTQGMKRLLALAPVLLVLVAACGGSSPARPATSAPAASAATNASSSTSAASSAANVPAAASRERADDDPTPTPGPQPAPPVDPTALPLGDGLLSAQPLATALWACQTRFNGGGAFRDGPWIHGKTWDSTAKIAVQGSVSWQGQFSVTVNGDKRVLTGNGLPNHATGTFPVAADDPAYQFDRNPNSIRMHNINVQLAANPVAAAKPTCAGGYIGYMLSGADLFNAVDALGRDAGAHEIQDACAGHPEMTGVYHYHTDSPCVADQNGLIGYALDGYGIYREFGPSGALLTDADLDECHGRNSVVTWDGQQVSMYHYDVTLEFPYTIGCYHGTPIPNGPP